MPRITAHQNNAVQVQPDAALAKNTDTNLTTGSTTQKPQQDNIRKNPDTRPAFLRGVAVAKDNPYSKLSTNIPPVMKNLRGVQAFNNVINNQRKPQIQTGQRNNIEITQKRSEIYRKARELDAQMNDLRRSKALLMNQLVQLNTARAGGSFTAVG